MASAASDPAAGKKENPLCNDVKRPLDLSLVKRGWYSAPKEFDYWVPQADIEGEIPRSLRGTFLRNGPGLLEVYGKKLVHREWHRRALLAPRLVVD